MIHKTQIFGYNLKLCMKFTTCILLGGRLNYIWVSSHKRWVALIATLIDNFVFGSYFFGYNALVEHYGRLGVFESYCTTADCPERALMFSYAYIAGVITQLCLAPVAGILMDRVGLRITKLISSSLVFFGSLMFAFTGATTSFMVFPGVILVAIGSFSGLLCSYHIGSMFHRIQGLVFSLISGAFDSSSAMAFVVSATVQWISLRTSFIVIAVVSMVYGTMMALVFMTDNVENMIPVKMIATDALKPLDLKENACGLTHEQTGKSVILKEAISGIIKQQYPALKNCIMSLPFMVTVFFYAPGILRFTYLAAQLDQQLSHAFPNDQTRIKTLKDASAAISMCGFLISPLTGVTLDMSKRIHEGHLLRRLTNPCVKLTDEQIYWSYMRSLVPAYFLHALLAVFISSGIFVTGQMWIFYGLFVSNMILTSLLSAGVTAAVMNAFPVTHFGTVTGLVTCCGGAFSTIQYGLLRLPQEVGNGIMLVISVFLFTPPLIILLKHR